MGKTRLCAEFARSCAAEGATVLTGRSDEQALLPYQPFIEALHWYMSMCPQLDLLSQLAEIGGGAELRLLLPELVRQAPALPVLAPMDAEGQRFRLFEAVSAFLAAISRSPAGACGIRRSALGGSAFFIDAAPSGESIRTGAPVRSGKLPRHRNRACNSARARCSRDLRRELFTARISLTGLGRPHVNELVESMARGVPDRLVEAVAENAEGNPFFVGEMVRHLIETGALDVLRDTITARRPELGIPEGIKDVIRQRLGRLSEDCNQVLGLAAVIGQEFDLTLLRT